MKKMMHYVCLVTLALGIQFANAQSTVKKSRASKWTSDEGFWVVETNVKTPKQSAVHFYTNESELMYTEAVQGTRLNTRKKKTLLRLKTALDQVVYVFEKEGKVQAGSPLLAIRQRH